MQDSQYLTYRRDEMIAFRKATKGMLCDDIYIHMWNLIRKEYEDYKNIPPHSGQYGITHTWSRNGVPHRDFDLPAVIYYNSDNTPSQLIWYKKGRIHRKGDKPAKIFLNKNLYYWYKKGKIHRDGDNPAILIPNGTAWWIRNNKPFREGGKPPIIESDGTQIWPIIDESWWTSIGHFPQFTGYREFQIDPDGIKRWYINNYPGRADDKPAVIYPNGTQIWYKECTLTGKSIIHRDGGEPAIICANGSKSWYHNGKLISFFKRGKFFTRE